MSVREKLIELYCEVEQLRNLRYGVAECVDILISNGVTVQKWIPVSERLPEDGVRVLACGECMIEPIAIAWYYDDFEVWRTDEYTYSPKEVAFWMPLPEPPKECE